MAAMKANPKADWSPEDVRVVARACGLTLRQRRTSHAVLTNGEHPTVPMHKPIKLVYIRGLVRLIEAAQRDSRTTPSASNRSPGKAAAS